MRTEPPAPPTEGLVSADPVILKRFRAALDAAYGDRLERVVLYGSRARGDAKPDSDYDIGVFIREHGTFTEESEHLAELSLDILLDTGEVINATPFPAGAYGVSSNFMRELRKDALEI